MKFNLTNSPEPADGEQITLSKGEISGNITVYTGQQGDFIVALIPSLNVSGYGRSETDAHQSLSENLETFLLDLLELSESDRYLELDQLGWIVNPSFKHQMSSAYLDELTVLQNFDNPAQVKKTTLQAA